MHNGGMSTPLTVGKARLASIIVTNPDGSPNLTASIGVSTGNASTLRVTVNPSDPREIAIVGLAPSAGVNAGVNINLGEGTKTASELVVISAAPAVTGLSSIALTVFGPEVTPPSWA